MSSSPANQSLPERPVDVVVIGGGIVGLSTAHRLLERFPGKSLVVIEKEPRLAQHQTGNNSGWRPRPYKSCPISLQYTGFITMTLSGL